MTGESRPHSEAELVDLIRSIDAPAPARLHDRVQEMLDAQRAPARRPALLGDLRVRLGAAATALAAVAAGLALALAGSGGAELSLAQASAVTLRPATLPAPAESGSDHQQLDASVEGTRFPYWGERFGWRSTGSRVDRVDGRDFHTVFYTDGKGHTVGYAIAAGRAPALKGAGSVHWRGGTPYWVGTAGGATVVTWKRGDHLCVVAGRGVAPATLLTLASWHDRASAA